MRRYLVFADATLSLFMMAIDTTAVAVAFPHITRDLGTNILWTAWSMSIYQLAATMIMPLAGKLSDSLGRRKVFLTALVLFTSSSFLCGWAPNILVLIVFRFVQGVGGGCFLPTASGIVSDHFPESRQSAIGMFSSIFAIGGIVGPNLGGWLVDRYSWRSIFYINVPIGIGLVILTLLLLKDPEETTRTRLDLHGASLFSGAMLFLMVGLNLIAEKISRSTFLFAALSICVSLSLIILFFREEKKASDPFFDLALLKQRPFLAANIYNMMIGACLFGVLAFVPFYAISVYKLSVLDSGLILTPRSIGMIAASVATSLLLKRWGYRWPMLLGLLVTCGITVLLGQSLRPLSLGMPIGDTEFLALLIMASGIGAGITLPPSNNACIELMPEKVATITGLRGMFRSVGGVLGISFVTVILHLSSSPASGFRVTFTTFGLGLLLALPLIFAMPSGRDLSSMRRAESVQMP